MGENYDLLHCPHEGCGRRLAALAERKGRSGDKFVDPVDGIMIYRCPEHGRFLVGAPYTQRQVRVWR